jgi:FkbH-like protein
MNQEEQRPAPKTRIAISATFTAELLRPSLEFWAQTLGSPAEIQFAPFNQPLQTLLDPGSEFGVNERGLNVLLVRLQDLGEFDGATSEGYAQVNDNAWHIAEEALRAAERLRAPLYVILCPSDPEFRHKLKGIRETLEEGLRGALNLHYLDADALLARYPTESWYDEAGDRIGKIPYTETMFAGIATAIMRLAHTLEMPPYKVIAVDCDNTLWKGICGEDGPEGVTLDAQRRRLHEFLLEQRNAGMLLALASKNNPEDVAETFRAHPEFPLQLEHFAANKVNWEPKSVNLQELAAELSLGLDSIIFVDDNPKECAEMQEGAPEVLALALPEPLENLDEWLNHVWAFDHPVVTDEDRKRAEFYEQGRRFEQAARGASSLEHFVSTLNLRVDLEPVAPERLSRVAQLTQRTNQFNCSAVRRTEAEIRSMLDARALECFTAEVSDRFGDYGLVGVLLVRRGGDSLIADTFLLSCRALGRGVEHRMLSFLAEQAEELGFRFVTVPFVPSAKNMPARKFLDSVTRGTRVEERDTVLYRFPVAELQGLRWKPVVAEAVPAEKPAMPAKRAGRRFAAYQRLAVELRTPEQVIARMRESVRPAESVLNGHGSPATEVEVALARIWSEVLHKPVSDVRSNFFDLGGHSLLAVLLLMRVKEEFGVELSVDDVYSSTLTLSELARTIEARQLADIDPEEYQALLAEIEGLSDDEVRTLLEEEERRGGGGAA